MPSPKIFRLPAFHVSIEKKQHMGKSLLGSQRGKNVPYVERKLYNLRGRNAKQRSFFEPEKRKLTIEIIVGDKLVSYLDARLDKDPKNRSAIIQWKFTEPAYRNQGLALQTVAEALDVLKKAGVKTVVAKAIGGFEIYRTLGFEEYGETKGLLFFKKLN